MSWKTPEEREEWAEDHGYSHYHCPEHGGFWSDSGPHCESCPEPEPGTSDDACPKCGSVDINPPDEGKWAECNDCGFVFYDAETLALQAEVLREQAVCKKVLGYVPSYGEALKKGLAK